MSAFTPASVWTNSTQEPLRLLIVDDSVVARTVLERIVLAHPAFGVAQKTSSAAHALGVLARERFDLILLDVEMPGESGLTALPAILAAGQGAKVIILSGNCQEGSAAAVEALAIGASDIMEKPGSGSYGDQFSRALLERIARIMGRSGLSYDAPHSPPLRSSMGNDRIACLGIGASTGGIHALGQLFAGLARPLGIPILLTQHLPPSFMPFFATQLARMTSLPVKIAQQGETLRPDQIYVAPGEANLTCRRSLSGDVSVQLSRERPPLGSLPAVDPMFASMAQCFGPKAGAVVLTGMGRDGTDGARRIVAEGGWVIVQDQESSVVWGMPGSIARAGLASAILTPDAIMPMVARRGAVAL
ncbi:chemotaxis protein CheB [Sphingobium aquiterrae]|uniref:chemotaxis protein CheB n=1 Tax=Sphingobium aquiterrae TaxID=2038656 RepID=UPI003017140A